MFYRLKKNIVNAQIYNRSRKLKKKIIVFESDDWGSIRTPSIEAVEAVRDLGGLTYLCPYAKFDTVERSTDIGYLTELLLKYKKPCITTNFVMTNPDFYKIEKDGFNKYYYKTFDHIYNDYYPSESVFHNIIQSMNERSIYPQFHGREHVNIPMWFRLLRINDRIFREAFKWRFWGVKTKKLNAQNLNIQATYRLNNKDREDYLEKSIKEGLAIFEKSFGFRSKSFIPNNYSWLTNYNWLLKNHGVNYLQGIKIQLTIEKNGRYKKRSPGKFEKGGLISIVRNGAFEPSFYPENRRKALDMCLADIEAAFRFKQPAVISTHRINFVSGLSVKNRDENLKLFDELLKAILQKWPDVEFMNTEELGDLYKEMDEGEI